MKIGQLKRDSYFLRKLLVASTDYEYLIAEEMRELPRFHVGDLFTLTGEEFQRGTEVGKDDGFITFIEAVDTNTGTRGYFLKQHIDDFSEDQA